MSEEKELPLESKIVPLELKDKFYEYYFGRFENSSIQQEGGVITVIINTPNPVKMLRELNLNITKSFNEFIEKELGDKPGLYDRSTIYETEVKDNNIFIRWAKFVKE